MTWTTAADGNRPRHPADALVGSGPPSVSGLRSDVPSHDGSPAAIRSTDGGRWGTSPELDSGAARSGDSGDEPDPLADRQRVEAILLITDSPLSPRRLGTLAGLADATAARTAVQRLNELYDSLGRAMRVHRVAGGFQMMTRPHLAPWLSRLSHLPTPVRLSIPMLETLAVVAYRGPVSRAEVEAIRGVACGELLRQLIERDLIRIAGRSEELGRPYLYDTSKRFLQTFGLSGRDALPAIDPDPLRTAFPKDSSTQPVSESLSKEPSVSIAIEPEVASQVVGVSSADAATVDPPAAIPASPTDAVAVIEDEEDDLYEDDEEGWEGNDDDWDDPDDDDDIVLDDDEEDDDEDEGEENDDDIDDNWEEVGDDDDEEDDDYEDDLDGEDDWDDDEDEDDDEDGEDEDWA